MSASLLFFSTLCMHAKSLQSCLTLCNLMDCSLPGSSVHGILQAEYWSGLPSPSPGDLPDPEIKLMSPALADRFLTAEPPGLPMSLLGCHNRKPRLGGSKNKSISHSPGAWKSKIKTPSSGWVSGGNSPPGGRTATSSLHPHMASAPCG